MIDQIEMSHMEDFQEIDTWLSKRYDSTFKQYFEGQRNIHKRILNSDTKITNEELEKIIIDIPLMLIEVAEEINKYKLRIESLKLNMKSRQIAMKHSVENLDEIEVENLNNKLLIAAYQMLIQRVEKEMSYSRELIMGAKKVWDSRINSDTIIPTGPVDRTDPLAGLPDYKIRGKEYIG